MRRPRHAEAGLEQRLIVGLAIVSDQHIELRQVLGEPAQQRSFLAMVAHEKLPQPETGRLDAAHADQKRVGPRAAGEPGSLRIQEGPLGGMRRLDGAVRERLEQVRRQLVQVRNVHAAVPPVALEQLLGFEVLAERSPHHFAAHQLFDEVARGPRVGPEARAFRRFSGPLPVDARNAPPQIRELFLDILHVRLLFAYYRTNWRIVQVAIVRGDVKSARLFFPILFTVVLAARLCHLDILWAEETLPLAAASQMERGKVLYRDLWFDKPPLLAWTYLAWDARDGFPLRWAGALYVLLACAIAWRFARDLWGLAEACWAAGLLAFYLVFDIPSAVTPLAADLLMLAPHLAAVWLAWRGRAFWSGVLAGIAFLINAKGLFVLAACAVWNIRALPLLLAGFAIPNAIAAGCLWSQGALGAYYEQVWKWGRVYAGVTFVENPVRNGLLRTAHWLGFHAAPVIAALYFWWRGRGVEQRWRWAAWAAI